MEDEADLRRAPAQEAKVTELGAWKRLRATEPFTGRDTHKAVVCTRWVLTWEMADGKKCVNAHPAAKGYQCPDLEDSNVDTSGRVSPRSSRLRAAPLGAIKKWKIWSLDIANADLQADSFGRDALYVILRNGAPRTSNAFGSLMMRR